MNGPAGPVLPGRSKTENILSEGAGDYFLPKKALFSAPGDLSGARIACYSGSIWLTQEGDRRDHILKPGGEITISRKGLVLIQSLTDASFGIIR